MSSPGFAPPGLVPSMLILSADWSVLVKASVSEPPWLCIVLLRAEKVSRLKSSVSPLESLLSPRWIVTVGLVPSVLTSTDTKLLALALSTRLRTLPEALRVNAWLVPVYDRSADIRRRGSSGSSMKSRRLLRRARGATCRRGGALSSRGHISRSTLSSRVSSTDRLDGVRSQRRAFLIGGLPQIAAPTRPACPYSACGFPHGPVMLRTLSTDRSPHIDQLAEIGSDNRKWRLCGDHPAQAHDRGSRDHLAWNRGQPGRPLPPVGLTISPVV